MASAIRDSSRLNSLISGNHFGCRARGVWSAELFSAHGAPRWRCSGVAQGAPFGAFLLVSSPSASGTLRSSKSFASLGVDLAGLLLDQLLHLLHGGFRRSNSWASSAPPSDLPEAHDAHRVLHDDLQNFELSSSSTEAARAGHGHIGTGPESLSSSPLLVSSGSSSSSPPLRSSVLAPPALNASLARNSATGSPPMRRGHQRGALHGFTRALLGLRHQHAGSPRRSAWQHHARVASVASIIASPLTASKESESSGLLVSISAMACALFGAHQRRHRGARTPHRCRGALRQHRTARRRPSGARAQTRRDARRRGSAPDVIRRQLLDVAGSVQRGGPQQPQERALFSHLVGAHALRPARGRARRRGHQALRALLLFRCRSAAPDRACRAISQAMSSRTLANSEPAYFTSAFGGQRGTATQPVTSPSPQVGTQARVGEALEQRRRLGLGQQVRQRGTGDVGQLARRAFIASGVDRGGSRPRAPGGRCRPAANWYSARVSTFSSN